MMSQLLRGNTPWDHLMEERTTLWLWFYLVKLWACIGMWSIIRQLKQLSEKKCFWFSLLILFCFSLWFRRKDAGFLSYKDHLPVSQVVVGDTDRQGSEAKLSVGPLRCQGDSKFAQKLWLALSYQFEIAFPRKSEDGRKQTCSAITPEETYHAMRTVKWRAR